MGGLTALACFAPYISTTVELVAFLWTVIYLVVSEIGKVRIVLPALAAALSAFQPSTSETSGLF
jgi:hypothetical protein